MTRIRGVIFDMDGVLIDAREWHYQALNQALASWGGMSLSRDAHEGEFDGLPTREKLARLTLRYGLPVDQYATIGEMKQRYTMQLVQRHCHPVTAHRYALARLVRAGYRLAVASNAVRQSVDVMLSRARLREYLQFTLCNEDVLRGKPDPQIYQLAMRRLGLSPEACVVVEDNPHGIAAATAAGAHVLTVRHPSEVSWPRIRDFIAACEAGCADASVVNNNVL